MSKDKVPHTDDIAKDVMQKIQQGDITMRPKYYFTLATAAGIAASVLLGVALAYTISLATWWLRSNIASGPAYGLQQKLDQAISGFPWWALLIAAILLVMLVFVIRKLGSLYRFRWYIITATILVVTVAAGITLSYLGLPGETHSPHNQNQGTGRQYRNR